MIPGAVLLLLATAGTAAGIHYVLTGGWSGVELIAAGSLLAVNYAIAVAATLRKSPEILGGALGFGLFLIALKLFVNTFTIFLLIGLKAVRTPVFVSEFLAAYGVLLFGSVWVLHRTTDK